MANAFDRITQDPKVLAGRASIRGLRISVAQIVNLLANGMTPAEIVADLPDLEVEDIRQALKSRTAMGADIRAIRARIVATGVPLLSKAEVLEEVHSRRGGYSEAESRE